MMIAGQIKKILNQKDNDWGRYKLDSIGKEICVVGVIPNACVGMSVSLDCIEENNQYGHQFKIMDVLSQSADPNAGAKQFLAGGYIKYLGLKKAEAIIAAYGKESVDLFDTPEGRAKLANVKGISTKTIDNAMVSYEANKHLKPIILFLSGAGTKNQVETIYKKYGDEAVNVLKKNPYRLQMDLEGFGFLRADSLALGIGIKPDSVYRVMAAIKYTLEEAMSKGGHCYLNISDIRAKVPELLVPTPHFSDISEVVANNALEKWPDSKEKLISNHNPSMDTIDRLSQTKESRSVISNVLDEALTKAIEDGDFIDDEGRIYTKKMYQLECGIADRISSMLNGKPIRRITPELIEKCIKDVEKRKTEALKAEGINSPFEITKEQREAVYLASSNRISIISGGPGRGKTAISEIVAHTFLSAGSKYDKKDIFMLAPTGRAAQRITESTGYDAMTAHRAIAYMKSGRYDFDNKLILCDETSMVDVFLLNSILKLAENSNIIFVGDVDQIASVGPGKVLRDMINSEKIPCILLKEGHRNSGTIAHNANLINNGMKLQHYSYDEHFVYIPTTSESILDVITGEYIAKIKEYGITNVMLCAAMRDRGPVAVNKLNKTLQEKLTKGNPEAIYGERIFRVGDRVMQTTNDYNFIIKRNGELTTGIFNGERGTVQKVFFSPEDDAYRLVVRFDDGSIGGYTKSTVVNLTLAFATTLHKCQGSEANCMMIAYTYSDYMLLNRSLFYTGVTRAKKELRMYGEEKYRYGKMLSAFDIAVSKTDDAQRNTSLARRIEEACKNKAVA